VSINNGHTHIAWPCFKLETTLVAHIIVIVVVKMSCTNRAQEVYQMVLVTVTIYLHYLPICVWWLASKVWYLFYVVIDNSAKETVLCSLTSIKSKVIFLCEPLVHYTFAKMAYMRLCYGCARGNAHEACYLYKEQFPGSLIADARMFTSIRWNLRERGTFVSAMPDWGGDTAGILLIWNKDS
jgi:hypothetical protein